MESSSAKLRRKANTILQSVPDEKPFFYKEIRFLNCLKLYNESYCEALCPYERSSSLKNISTVSFRLFEVYAAQGRDNLALFYAEQTQIKSLEAYELGKQSNVQNSQWLGELKDKQITYANAYLMSFLRSPKFSGGLKEQVDMMLKLKKVSADHVKCWIDFKIAEAYYYNSISYRDHDLPTSFRSINEGLFINHLGYSRRGQKKEL
jgi:hypothetical protein